LQFDTQQGLRFWGERESSKLGIGNECGVQGGTRWMSDELRLALTIQMENAIYVLASSFGLVQLNCVFQPISLGWR